MARDNRKLGDFEKFSELTWPSKTKTLTIALEIEKKSASKLPRQSDI